MKKILNISNHNLTGEQLKECEERHWEVVELPEDLKKRWSQCNPGNYEQLCFDIEEYMRGNNIHLAHLAGYPAAVVFMCKYEGFSNIVFYYAQSIRTSVEIPQPDGTVLKQNVFKHEGFYPYYHVK